MANLTYWQNWRPIFGDFWKQKEPWHSCLSSKFLRFVSIQLSVPKIFPIHQKWLEALMLLKTINYRVTTPKWYKANCSKNTAKMQTFSTWYQYFDNLGHLGWVSTILKRKLKRYSIFISRNLFHKNLNGHMHSAFCRKNWKFSILSTIFKNLFNCDL